VDTTTPLNKKRVVFIRLATLIDPKVNIINTKVYNIY